ncbi:MULTISPECIES: ferritin-like domain-containing protein [unclassified Campylobacter]|uniref:ferritin-like domain-containing protein n=1 Tax=unclassified Campylobacter TaxID=2593542 RepID=UPI001237BECC|nr:MULTISPECIES: DUF455 family protein [unclassified Campylobacter]KAA6225883.1 ferritin-like domain-containing protein [Campylobacter sp. LR185c]KAA6227007.1 ferritin-like domain-containing protein [Campylobacter sp. LR196d]KAA6227578.1 ferritin-like domain-containing protein [Campylobacter sp. LR286c]KAA6229444.1 ferritin-like domain-containing protein [Campylobacter sp. LR264d]KAA6230688.1 ferritin-like domain-containing protein [Campylobacter sp. LR291e]
MKEFFSSIEKILYENDLGLKFKEFENFFDDFKSTKIIFNMQTIPLEKDLINTNLKVLHPTRIRRPKSTNSNTALAKIIHSVAHIEFCAINLALDALYRFKDLPMQFYKDWLEVADEEIKHFKLLVRALNELGFEYSSFAVHNNLYEAMNLTKDNLALRMGVVHKGLEAKGLDANPFVIAKIQHSNNPIKSYIEEVLKIILEDEIKHVKKGNIWWEFAKKDMDFLSICKDFNQFCLAGKKLNIHARLRAGFKKEELIKLENFYN